MKKKITALSSGTLAMIGDMEVKRLLPGGAAHAVGPFVFLDHLLPVAKKPKRPQLPTSEGAHPHRGIAIFTYLFNCSVAF